VRDVFIDVTADIRLDELRRIPPGRRAGEILEVLRRKADAECERVGARLRTDREPELHLRDAQHPLGWDVLLVASRWAVVAPESLAVP
jgi:hypothetical protein